MLPYMRNTVKSESDFYKFNDINKIFRFSSQSQPVEHHTFLIRSYSQPISLNQKREEKKLQLDRIFLAHVETIFIDVTNFQMINNFLMRRFYHKQNSNQSIFTTIRIRVFA